MNPDAYTGFAAHVNGEGAGMMFIYNNFGVAGLSIAELCTEAYDISEGATGADAVWPAGLSMDFGAFLAGCRAEDMDGTVVAYDADTGAYVGYPICAPVEPGSSTLLILGGAVALRRRRRAAS